MLTTVHPTLNDHEYYMRPACVVHAVWCHFILVPSTPFSPVPWSVLWLCRQLVTDVTAWLIDPNPSCSKNRKIKIKIKIKRKVKSSIDDLDKDIVIITNKVATFSDLNIMKKYVKMMNNIDISDIMSLRLSQSKLYFKILGIPYFVKNTNLPITSDVVATTSHNDQWDH